MAAPLFTFAALDGTSTDFVRLRNDLEREYSMPTAEDWQRFDRKFQLLRTYFEQGTDTTDETDIPTQQLASAYLSPSNDASKARASVLPRVKVFKAGKRILHCQHRPERIVTHCPRTSGTFSMKVVARDEPLVCKAIGTMSPERYEDIFWERVAEVEEQERIKVEVFTIKATSLEVIIFMRFGRLNFLEIHCL